MEVTFFCYFPAFSPYGSSSVCPTDVNLAIRSNIRSDDPLWEAAEAASVAAEAFKSGYDRAFISLIELGKTSPFLRSI